MPTLQNYVTETQRLLHDGSAQYWTVSELTDYINEGRTQVVCDTGCNRLLQTIYLSAGIEQYIYGPTASGVTGAVVTNGGSLYTSAPAVSFTPVSGGTGATATATINNGAVTMVNITNLGVGYEAAPLISFSGGGGSGAAANSTIILPGTLDILNVTVLWGNQRIVLGYQAWSAFNVSLRVWQNFLSRPTTWSNYGQNSFFVGPIPDQTYLAEVDSVFLPAALVNLTDVDTINPPFSFPVSYYAAHKAKIKEQSYGESEKFKSMYTQRVMEVLRASVTRLLPNQY